MTNLLCLTGGRDDHVGYGVTASEMRDSVYGSPVDRVGGSKRNKGRAYILDF